MEASNNLWPLPMRAGTFSPKSFSKHFQVPSTLTSTISIPKVLHTLNLGLKFVRKISKPVSHTFSSLELFVSFKNLVEIISEGIVYTCQLTKQGGKMPVHVTLSYCIE